MIGNKFKGNENSVEVKRCRRSGRQRMQNTKFKDHVLLDECETRYPLKSVEPRSNGSCRLDHNFKCYDCHNLNQYLHQYMILSENENGEKCTLCSTTSSKTSSLLNHTWNSGQVPSTSCGAFDVGSLEQVYHEQNLEAEAGKNSQALRESSRKRESLECKSNITKSHVCTICSKMFSTKRQLSKHKIVHTSERPYVCNLCQKSFKHPQNLEAHTFRHKIKRGHPCEICGLIFVHISELVKHRPIHQQEVIIEDTSHEQAKQNIDFSVMQQEYDEELLFSPEGAGLD